MRKYHVFLLSFYLDLLEVLEFCQICTQDKIILFYMPRSVEIIISCNDCKICYLIKACVLKIYSNWQENV